MTDLERLEALKAELKNAERRREATYAIWTAWKYYAQDEDFFDDLIHDLRIPWKELKWVRPAEHHSEVTYEHGKRLWESRLKSINECENLKQEIDALLISLRREGVLLKDIAKYYGSTSEGLTMYFQKNKLEWRSDEVSLEEPA